MTAQRLPTIHLDVQLASPDEACGTLGLDTAAQDIGPLCHIIGTYSLAPSGAGNPFRRGLGMGILIGDSVNNRQPGEYHLRRQRNQGQMYKRAHVVGREL